MFEYVGCILILFDFFFFWQVVDEFVVKRFYLILMLYDLWRQKFLWEVVEKFDQFRGFIQNFLFSTVSFGVCVYYFCQVTLVTLQVVFLKLLDVYVYMYFWIRRIFIFIQKIFIFLIFLLILILKFCFYSFFFLSRMYLVWGKFKIFFVKIFKRCFLKWYNI